VCGSTSVRKTITAPAVHYRGSGWAKKERRAAASKKVPATGGSGSDADAGGSESVKPEADKKADDRKADDKKAYDKKATDTGSSTPAAKGSGGTD
jgi:hypothetical protein